tara:strand:+ start:261 stop:518 length:258 start_codon:yes stop_codon:yes gene_type:complete
MTWRDEIKKEEKESLPVLEELLELVKNRIREMEGVLKDSDEEDSIYVKADYILKMANFAFERIEYAEGVFRKIDQEYAELVDMLR